jgi:glycosyltransferase involved in cell wall biosynthesis
MTTPHIRVLSTFTDPRLGGPHRRSIDVARRLRDRNIETAFLLPTGDDKFETASEKFDFEIYRQTLPRLRPPTRVLENGRFLASFPRVTRRVKRFIDDKDFDIVHTNMAFNFQSALAAHRSTAKSVWHFNDTLTPTPVKQIAGALGPRLADEIVVASDAVHDYFFDPDDQSRTIYAPVNIEEFDSQRIDVDQQSLRMELGIPASVPVIGTVGNINPIKGHEYLLRAIAELNTTVSEVAVPIIGEKLDSRTEYLEKLRSLRSELGLEDQVTFVGFRSDIPELLSLFDVFVLPSIAEACPIVVLEAMAMKCPVVATAVGGVPEEIPNEDYGWLVPPKDSTALAGAIQDVLDNPVEAKRRAENARGRVESTFSLTACVDRHETLYRSVVED